jgi:hypothetical protein
VLLPCLAVLLLLLLLLSICGGSLPLSTSRSLDVLSLDSSLPEPSLTTPTPPRPTLPCTTTGNDERKRPQPAQLRLVQSSLMEELAQPCKLQWACDINRSLTDFFEISLHPQQQHQFTIGLLRWSTWSRIRQFQDRLALHSKAALFLYKPRKSVSFVPNRFWLRMLTERRGACNTFFALGQPCQKVYTSNACQITTRLFCSLSLTAKTPINFNIPYFHSPTCNSTPC